MTRTYRVDGDLRLLPVAIASAKLIGVCSRATCARVLETVRGRKSQHRIGYEDASALHEWMPHIPTLEPAEASDDVREVYLDFQRRMGFPSAPNFIKTQGHSLAAARGTWGLVQNVLVGGLLPRTLKEMMFSAISKDRACRYCEAAHLACCRMLGVDSRTLEQLVANVESLTPEKARDIILFGVKCARDPQSLGSADYDRLRHHGLTQPEIVELVAMSALAVYANIIADATGMPADAMFTEF